MKIGHPLGSDIGKDCKAKDFIKETAWTLLRRKPVEVRKACETMNAVAPPSARPDEEYALWLQSAAQNRQQTQCNAVVLVCGFIKANNR
jgi:hypothetical protein